MIAAYALILLADVASTCPAPGSARLGGGAKLVLPVGTFEPLPFEPLGPATSIVTKPTEIQHTGATAPQGDPQSVNEDEPLVQCAAPFFPIA